MALLPMLLYFTHYFSQPRLGQTKQGVIPRWLSFPCYYILHNTLVSHVWDKQTQGVIPRWLSFPCYFILHTNLVSHVCDKQNKVLYPDDSLSHVTIFYTPL